MTISDGIASLGLIIALVAVVQSMLANRGVAAGKVELAERTADLRVVLAEKAAVLGEKVARLKDDARRSNK